MDANGTRYHLLLGEPDWARCADANRLPLGESWSITSPPGPASNRSGLDWDSKRQELTLQSRVFQFQARGTVGSPPSSQALDLKQRRGAASDLRGNWYWIDESGNRIRVTSACSETAFDLWSGENVSSPPSSPPGAFHPVGAGTGTALPLCGLTVTDEQYLVVGVLQPPGLLIFDLYTEGPPRQIFWPSGVPFAPFDMAPAPKGGVWVLDRDEGRPARYWALDRHFWVIPPGPDECLPSPPPGDFRPCDGAPRPLSSPPDAPPISLQDSVELPNPFAVAIDGLPDGSVLILESPPLHSPPARPFSIIRRYRSGQQKEEFSTELMLDRVDAAQREAFRLLGHDFALVPGSRGADGSETHVVYVVGEDGNQAYAFELKLKEDQLRPQSLPDFLPMRLFGGKGLVTARKQAYYDFGERWLPLVTQRRPRYESAAVLFTPAFDSREPDCVWHRLMLDGCIPPEANVQVWSRAANSRLELDLAAWRAEPTPYRRGDGSELPFVGQPAGEHRGTWELLLQQAEGQHLELKIRLSGDGRTTPRLRALRAYYPRFSYLEHYLPAVYRQDSSSASFLDRFLANLEGFHTTLEDKIAAVQTFLDVDGTPSEALDWLASWFGVALDPAWDERKRRLFLRYAMFFFQYRGTVCGLQMALHLALDNCVDERLFTERPTRNRRLERIRIVEHYRARRTPGVLLGDPTDLDRPRWVEPSARWRPELGTADLHRRYRDAYGLPAERSFSLVAPLPPEVPGPEEWRAFAKRELGFVPAAPSAPLASWQAFLARRYPTIDAFNLAYGLSSAERRANFSEVPLPDRVPVAEAPLRDWYQFETGVLPMRSAAHRFSVLLPAPPEIRGDRAEQDRRRDLAGRLVDLEKPAHTAFDVKFYWAYFRIGAARLEYDTLLDQSSRVPELLQPLLLGQGHLAESYLAPALAQH